MWKHLKDIYERKGRYVPGIGNRNGRRRLEAIAAMRDEDATAERETSQRAVVLAFQKVKSRDGRMQSDVTFILALNTSITMLTRSPLKHFITMQRRRYSLKNKMAMQGAGTLRCQEEMTMQIKTRSRLTQMSYHY